MNTARYKAWARNEERRLGRGLARCTGKAAAISKTVWMFSIVTVARRPGATANANPPRVHDVDRLTRHPERRYRSEDRERNVQADERTAPIPQKHQHH